MRGRRGRRGRCIVEGLVGILDECDADWWIDEEWEMLWM